MRKTLLIVGFAALAAGLSPARAQERINDEQRALLIRALVAEHGLALTAIPRSKKPLDITRDGQYDMDVWLDAMDENGPAANEGNLIQVTKIEFKGKRIEIELNHGINGGRRWWHRIQMSSGGGMGGGQTTGLGDGRNIYAPGGTKIALLFDDQVPPVEADEVKEMLKSVLDFNERSADELYIEKLPPEFQEAIKQERAMTGMDRDMVLLARGRPDNKYRSTKDGVETEDWIYGVPPGNVTFVTFDLGSGKVISIKDSYANVGGDVRTKEDLETPPEP